MQTVKALFFLLMLAVLAACSNHLYPNYDAKKPRKYNYADFIELKPNHTYTKGVRFCSSGQVIHYGNWFVRNDSLILQTSLDVNNVPMLCDTADEETDFIVIDITGKGAPVIDTPPTLVSTDTISKNGRYAVSRTVYNKSFTNPITIVFNDTIKFTAPSFPVKFLKHTPSGTRIESFRVIISPMSALCCYRYPVFTSEKVYTDESRQGLDYTIDFSAIPSLGFYEMDTTAFKIKNNSLEAGYVIDKGRKWKYKYKPRLYYSGVPYGLMPGR